MSALAEKSFGRCRIVYLAGTNADWGGASRVLFNTLRALDRQRFEPVVLLSRPGPGVAVLDALGIAHQVWRPVPDLAQGAVGYLAGVARAMRMLHSLRTDLLHVNFDYWRPAEVVAARLLGIPIVTHFHVVVPAAGPLLRFSSAIAAVSAFVVASSDCAGRQAEVIPNTVPLDRFDRAVSLRAELGLDESLVVVSFVGQIREEKGIDSFLRLARAIDSASVRFLIAGECRDPSRYAGAYDRERLQREIGDDERIIYLGYRRDVENVFRTTDILVVPSRWGEPFGLINIEAGAAGIPVVATRDGGIPEVVRDNETGLLVDVGDEEGLVAAVRRLIESPELRSRLGRRAREVVEADFTSAPVRKLESLYLRLLGR